ncbi:amidase domain-containing protein [Thermoanaerobacterium sp. R66]|uniref:amidase domain-containing protein n=1 Tax=Thermoanaerobacterium sp. R66 TaxID=2742479 RepID=UPI0023806438|nr:amidase domain-containing protein [Thermoanaerobacterium sp. R66]MDE4543121.1 amidase domain-containing protein [Thermoanaerobacterium sp. R66]
MIRTRILMTLIIVVTSLFMTSNVYASYDRINATIYADAWALGRNSNYPTNWNSDCADFVSQCLHEGGGLPFDDIHGWYIYKNLTGFYWGNAWSVAKDLMSWLLYYEGDNYQGATYIGNWGPDYQPDSNSLIQFGDVLIYDWGTGEGWSHAAIVADYGQDPNSPYYGNLQDQHTTDRKWAIWHLKAYNKNWRTTTIAVIRPN